MSISVVSIAVLPLVFVLVIVLECSRLHCASLTQRRYARVRRVDARMTDEETDATAAAGQLSPLAE